MRFDPYQKMKMIRHEAVAECICNRSYKECVLLEKKFIFIVGLKNLLAAIRVIVYMIKTIRFQHLIFVYRSQGSKNKQKYACFSGTFSALFRAIGGEPVALRLLSGASGHFPLLICPYTRTNAECRGSSRDEVPQQR